MIVIALGSNIASQAGDPQATLRAALVELAQNGVVPRTVSPFYATHAWPDPSDPVFVNAAADVATGTFACKSSGAGCMTSRPCSNKPARPAQRAAHARIWTLWITTAGSKRDRRCCRIRASKTRAFVLVPLYDIAPDWRHPVSGNHIGDLLAAIPAAEKDAIVRIV